MKSRSCPVLVHFLPRYSLESSASIVKELARSSDFTRNCKCFPMMSVNSGLEMVSISLTFDFMWVEVICSLLLFFGVERATKMTGAPYLVVAGCPTR